MRVARPSHCQHLLHLLKTLFLRRDRKSETTKRENWPQRRPFYQRAFSFLMKNSNSAATTTASTSPAAFQPRN
jgi:hypothetical protein